MANARTKTKITRTGTYWYLTGGEGWVEGETETIEGPKPFPVPLLQPAECFAVGIAFMSSLVGGRYWSILWRWQADETVENAMKHYGSRPAIKF